MQGADRRLKADDVHAKLADRWPDVLARFVDGSFLTGRHGPCPMCGGKDRWRFTNFRLRGDWICNGCGNGDGFTLLQRLHNWDFMTALREVIAAAGIGEGPRAISDERTCPAVRTPATIQASPSRRVRDLLRTSCSPSDVPDVVAYLKSRNVWPLPAGCTLRGHVGLDYFNEDRERIGRFSALVAPVVDAWGEFVTAHVTYLQDGQKLAGHEPRKLLGPLTGRHGCAVRLTSFEGPQLGIAEGIETALAARRLHRMPVWSALNAALLAKFQPPEPIESVTIFADRDTAGLEAAWRLRDQLTMPCSLDVPPRPSKDWCEHLAREVARHA